MPFIGGVEAGTAAGAGAAWAGAKVERLAARASKAIRRSVVCAGAILVRVWKLCDMELNDMGRSSQRWLGLTFSS
jgi:hypothetical protein